MTNSYVSKKRWDEINDKYKKEDIKIIDNILKIKMNNSKIMLIAEIGENYLGKITLAKKLIENAKKSGANYAKFQSYNENCLKKTILNITGLKSLS